MEQLLKRTVRRSKREEKPQSNLQDQEGSQGQGGQQVGSAGM